MVNLDMLATVIFTSRVWSPGKNTIVVLEVKYDLVCCTYSESVAQRIELWGQSEHEVSVGLTQYTFSAEQQERVLSSSAATWTMNGVEWIFIASGVDWTILTQTVGKEVSIYQYMFKHEINIIDHWSVWYFAYFLQNLSVLLVILILSSATITPSYVHMASSCTACTHRSVSVKGKGAQLLHSGPFSQRLISQATCILCSHSAYNWILLPQSALYFTT